MGNSERCAAEALPGLLLWGPIEIVGLGRGKKRKRDASVPAVMMWQDCKAQRFLRAEVDVPGAYLTLDLGSGGRTAPLQNGVFRTDKLEYASEDTRYVAQPREDALGALSRLAAGTIVPTVHHLRPFGVCGPDPLESKQRYAAVAIGGVVEMVVEAPGEVMAGDVVVVSIGDADAAVVPRAVRADSKVVGSKLATVLEPGTTVSRRTPAYLNAGFFNPQVCTVMLHINDGPAPPAPGDDLNDFCRIICSAVDVEGSATPLKMAEAITLNPGVAVTKQTNELLRDLLSEQGEMPSQVKSMASDIVIKLSKLSSADASSRELAAELSELCRDLLAWTTGLSPDDVWGLLWNMPLGWDPKSGPDVFLSTYTFTVKDLVAMSVLALRAAAKYKDSLGV